VKPNGRVRYEVRHLQCGGGAARRGDGLELAQEFAEVRITLRILLLLQKHTDHSQTAVARLVNEVSFRIVRHAIHRVLRWCVEMHLSESVCSALDHHGAGTVDWFGLERIPVLLERERGTVSNELDWLRRLLDRLHKFRRDVNRRLTSSSASWVLAGPLGGSDKGRASRLVGPWFTLRTHGRGECRDSERSEDEKGLHDDCRADAGRST